MTMDGKVVLITGANSGIGYETTKGLAALGARIVMVCRDQAKCETAREDIEAAVPGAELEVMLCDLASLADIRRFAAEFKEDHDRLDVLFNNAGGVPHQRQVTVDGIEWQLAVNHLAPFLLTHLLIDMLLASVPSQVVTTSSGTHVRGKVDLDDLQAERRYRPHGRYASTKLMNIMFTRSLARRLEDTGMRANCLSPGLVDTGLSRDYGPMMRWLVKRFAKPRERGGETPVWVISSPELAEVTGAYFRNLKRKDVSKKAKDDATAEALWRESERLVGLTEEERAAMPVRPQVTFGGR
jgi:NAD(P)-dependent dehydrogenase (short-subunit alcohol dehydrogenase family)